MAAFSILISNVLVALMFAATFLALARGAGAEARAVRWFAASYAAGAATPASEIAVRLMPDTAIFVALSYGTFSLGLHLMAKGLADYFRVPLPAWLLPASFLGSLALRAAIWGGARDTMPYELLYQLPFAVAMAICGFVVMRRAGNVWERLLHVMFWLDALHFAVKPFAAVALGSGATAGDYAASRYALVSQSLTGILLTATALVLVVVVICRLLNRAQADADTDLLSGVPNRRGFDRLAAPLLAAAGRTERPGVAALLFDLDHFKSFNDRFGHAAGDAVIVGFARLLRDAAPAGSVFGRMGGEEFAALLPGATPAAARLFGEAIRSATCALVIPGLPGDVSVSVSAGLAMMRPGDTISSLMAGADTALYAAKSNGRNRVELRAGPEAAAGDEAVRRRA